MLERLIQWVVLEGLWWAKISQCMYHSLKENQVKQGLQSIHYMQNKNLSCHHALTHNMHQNLNFHLCNNHPPLIESCNSMCHWLHYTGWRNPISHQFWFENEEVPHYLRRFVQYYDFHNRSQILGMHWIHHHKWSKSPDWNFIIHIYWISLLIIHFAKMIMVFNPSSSLFSWK